MIDQKLKMKKINITLLLLCAVGFLACKKDSVEPEIKKYEAAQQTITPVDSTTAAAFAIQAIGQNIMQGKAINSTVQYIRLQLAKDKSTTDDIIIDFAATASVNYVKIEDAATLPGMGAVSLSSLSADNVPLAINALPFPKTGMRVGLKIGAKTDGTYSLNLTAIQAIPKLFDIWLMDNFTKDSLDIRHNLTYAFNLYTADATSYGSNRFSLLILQNPALVIHLLNVTAATTSGGVKFDWLTENEQDYTKFTVERSIDSGANYTALSTFTSTGVGTYSFTDKTPPAGTNVYRLKIVDINGIASYSRVVTP